MRDTVGRAELPFHLKQKLDDVIKARYKRLYGGGAATSAA
jgi:hypothetical protein